MSDFSKLSEIADVVDSLHKTPKYSDVGKPMVRCTDVKYGRLKLDDTFRVSDAVFEEFSRRYKPSHNDIVITRVGSYGITALVEDTNFCLGQNTSVIIPKINPRYLYATLNSPQIKNQIESSVVGSTQKTLSLKAINNLEIPRFDPAIEERIGKIIGELDDKIELNRQINQTLEQIAQTLFKSWFVDFEPVKAKVIAREKGGDALAQTLAAQAILSGAITLQQLQDMQPGDKGLQAQLHPLITKRFPDQYGLDYWTPETLQTPADAFPDELVESELGEIPKGWNTGVVGDFIDFNPRRTLKKGAVAPYLDMKNMPTSGHLADDVIPRKFGSGTKFVNGDTLLARITPCLENGKTAFVDFLKKGEVAWGSTEYIVMHTKDDYPECFSYLLARHESFRQFAMQSMMGTSGRQRASADAIANMPWVIPRKDIAYLFGNYASLIMAQIKSSGGSNKILANIRVSLLPKLLSGEITLGDTKSATEAVS